MMLLPPIAPKPAPKPKPKPEAAPVSGDRSYVWCPAGHYVTLKGTARNRAIVAARIQRRGCGLDGTCRRK